MSCSEEVLFMPCLLFVCSLSVLSITYLMQAQVWALGTSESPHPSYTVTVSLPQLGMSAVAPDATPAPGNTYEVRLVTEVPYYYVDWYVKAPWDTSERGTHEEYDPGDGTLTEATFSYTFPSGVMNTGDFIITAVYYLWSSDPNEYEETLTVTVSLD